MKGIKDMQFFFIAAVLVIAIACGQNAAPATEPGEGWKPPRQLLRPRLIPLPG